MTVIADCIDKLKLTLTVAKAKFEHFELDQRNELDEAIFIKKVPAQKFSVTREESFEDSVMKIDFDVRSDKDWTHNKPKAKQLSESVDKMQKTLEQVLKIYQANLNTTTVNESKINKILGRQSDQTLKVYLFRRLVRIYFGERICLNDLIQKLLALIDLLNHVKQELAWIWKTFYEDENIDKLISVETKMDIFAYMRQAKTAEVCAKVLTMQCICVHLFKQFEIVQILFKDKYPDFQTHASMEDIHSWQQTIRKGSKRRMSEEGVAQAPKSPNRSHHNLLTVENRQSTPRKDSDPKESPYAFGTSPGRSSKK